MMKYILLFIFVAVATFFIGACMDARAAGRGPLDDFIVTTTPAACIYQSRRNVDAIVAVSRVSGNSGFLMSCE